MGGGKLDLESFWAFAGLVWLVWAGWFSGSLRMQSLGSGDSRRSLGHESSAHLGGLAERFSADGVRNYKRNKIGEEEYARST